MELNRLSDKEIQKIIRSRPLEESDVIRYTEQYLRKKGKRAVNPIPPPGTAVILMVSGGMDSTMVWGYLLSVYKLQVYPVYFERGHRRVAREKEAVAFFSEYYRRRYPKCWHEVQYMKAYIPPKEIRFPITIVSGETSPTHPDQSRGIPLYSNLLFSFAVQYGYYLEITQGIHARTVFSGFMLSDGETMKDETLTAMRAINLTVCSLTNDYEWRIVALPLEKNIGFHYGKSPFIRWAARHRIPLEKTRSCIMWEKQQCGDCLSCVVRKTAFEESGIPDRTVYEKVTFARKVRKKLRNMFLQKRPGGIPLP